MQNAPLVIGAVLVALSLTACAPAEDGDEAAAPGGSAVGGAPAADTAVADGADDTGDASSTDYAGVVDAGARDRAQAWLDAAVVPPGAIPSDASVAEFSSFTGWPCGPVAELEAFWAIPGVTVSETANWLQENPTADLLSTALGPVPDDQQFDGATVGYVPAPDSQEGVVYTVKRTLDGVVVRAEIAALSESATCDALPDGAIRGAPGQG
ncbi:hypothetical protein [Oerskovia merdavium]|uniref:Lipoprotein n=1 Tax=Oerskovia merdavium TaxID=2762227 RepID=A0ABR8U1W0_9CELL|nr:hypothetical protein [Oerskovia merdavium]MBD7982014.1 hypothetical protein [Oerskovia merdavium]